ncbi:phosphatidate cytidylyltransferase [Nisaea acidiphila]|uniref:Phosphatidate cytidylyltransferase n=1 Tax=Nisaea acidiphila TaxID=1862145 RepID=A0A9J7AV78_9PROT|nr:phosphatidate cytidylyltransferase [Nisaea acidiphila]UUX50369.1 phosphatidate cytidylyltransferase [Nisaea acidiphila]
MPDPEKRAARGDSVNGSDKTAVPNPRARELTLRVLSSVIILPPVLLLFWVGGPYFLALVTVMAAAMAWEWANLVAPRCPASLRRLAGLIGALLVLAASLAFEKPVALVVLLALPLAFAGAVRIGSGSWMPQMLPGLLLALCPAIAIYWIRELPDFGLETALWLALSVVVTDVAAYCAGKSIGGPKIWVRVSPNKTWAGLIGGMLGAAAFGAGLGMLVGPANPLVLAGCGVVIALLAQAGDFAESAIKRAFGAKDSGRLIPGHGGILDRVDGQITVLPVAALAMLATGESILLWSWS